ncbi:microcin C transport system substrate-binding protein [Mesorhizobium soli]|uniref:extracellular solute-binding protein n=1 Tax=Pseudaminobacter soli (ex Li et al. 2025) TaxID=1295366 RepID=UPI0024755492|nr:extracellular solute-binding protein [Mesorhizobium soli]MDH6230951.1 microcin C transport system substrate-binding protein [Mesorhizobium soli]
MRAGLTQMIGKLGLVPAILAASLFTASADEWRTSSSLGAESKYGNDFKQYDYVNPNAPKGGTLNSVVTGTYDSFNPYIVAGAPAAGFADFGGGLLYETLMEQSLDEPSVSHAMIAEAFKYPDDFSSATYRLNPKARWHDGTPITVEDVIWSFNTLKANNPRYNRYYANVTEAVAVGDHEVEFRFDQKGNRELPKIMGDLVVLPKHWWEGTDKNGKKRDITRPTLEAPLGSGAYKVESFKPGSEIVWVRVPDHWSADLGVNVGRNNFDRRRYTYITDDNAAWQAFTKGGYEDIRRENSSRRWMTEYNFPAVKAGDVLKKEFPSTATTFMQGFALNLRRPQFQDRRVREALTLAFDFESMNRTLFFGQNTRTSSFFVGSELASSGLPKGKELEILEAYRDQLPPELFTQEFKLPVYDNPQAERQYLRQAVGLFAEAGWKISNGKMVNDKGEQFKIEFLGSGATDELISSSFINTLRKIGIDASLRVIDTSQYINRINNFDFDAATTILNQSNSPGNEQRDFWSSKAADTPGTRNLMGIKSPVVDSLVDRIIYATDRDDLVAATHALDRVLLWNYYVIPQWHRPKQWYAYWNKFGMPEKQPAYTGADTDSWWIDPEKEKALAAKYRGTD